MTEQELKKEIKENFTFRSFYGNGDYIGNRRVTRITENSVFTVMTGTKFGSTYESRESWNTVLTKFKTGIYQTK